MCNFPEELVNFVRKIQGIDVDFSDPIRGSFQKMTISNEQIDPPISFEIVGDIVVIDQVFTSNDDRDDYYSMVDGDVDDMFIHGYQHYITALLSYEIYDRICKKWDGVKCKS